MYESHDIYRKCPYVIECSLVVSIFPLLNRYNECYNVYRDIIRTTSDDFDVERETNIAAVAVNRTIEGVVSLDAGIIFIHNIST